VLLAQSLFHSTIFITKYTIYIITYRICSCCAPSGRTFLCATDNRVKLLILLDGTLWLVLSVKEGRRFDPMKTWIKKKQHYIDTFQPLNYVTLEDQVKIITSIIRYVRESDNYKKKKKNNNNNNNNNNSNSFIFSS
jgi:hypothetical protein